MARLTGKTELGTKTIVEITVEGGVYMSESGIIHHNCNTCIKLHLHPDGTPKVFKYSELSKNYYVRGEEFPSILGQHPFCRCTLAYLGRDYGFNSQGRAVFITHGHDEYKKQRG